MSKATKHWKRGRGKLGILAPLIGSWKATASTPMGPVTCTLTFEPVLGANSEAIGFEARMPAGLARMAYWPDDADGFHWSVEAKNKKRWRRFTEHHYIRR